jgi:hypothetical protein
VAIKVSKDPDNPHLVECNRNDMCMFRLTFKTYEEAKRWDDPKQHGCPRRGPTGFGASVTQTLLEQAWGILDQHMGIVQSIDKDHPERVIWMARCRGVAEVLALFMPPHFRTADEIAREAMKRWQAAQNGEPRRTAGLGDLKYTFPDDPKYKRPLAQAAYKKAKAEAGQENVDPKTREDILVGKAFMTPQQLAEAFNLNIKTVEHILAEAS